MPGRALCRHVGAQLLQPGGGRRVAGRAPVAAGRERAAGADFRAVGDRRALELADREEAIEEHLQPAPDRGEVVGAALLLGEVLRPGSGSGVAPRLVAEIGDLAGAEAVASGVVEIEVL